MKPRDRQAGGASPQTAPAVPLKESSAASYQAGPPGVFVWDEWYRSASPNQQAELLELARRQGLLYLHQIPPHTNGHYSNGNGTEVPADSPVLKELLAGQAGNLVPVTPDALPVHGELDPWQRQAVARALSTPDICLIHGPPGTGKSRVVRELLVQASQKGLRVLFLAQSPACVDGVLEQIARDEGLLPIRLAAPAETVPSALQPMLLGQRVGNFRSQILQKANDSRAHAEEQCRQRQNEAEVWSAFAVVIEQRRQIEERVRSLGDELARVAADVESRAETILGDSLKPLLNEKEDGLERVRKSQAELDQQIAKLQQEETDLARQLQTLIDQERHGWWTLAWWKYKLFGKASAGRIELDARLQAARTALATQKEQRQTLDIDGRQIEQAFCAQRDRLVQEEIARRQQSLSEQEVELKTSLRQTDEQWASLAGRIALEKLRPQGMSVEAVEEARRLWQTQRQSDEENCLLARQWASYLQESGDRLAARLPGLAGIVAGSLAAWNHEGASIPGSFDLLILEEADRVSEQTLLSVARRARRWVLIANYLGPPPPPSPAPANPREVRPVVRPNVFQKLWQLLHCDPSQLPYTWGQEDGRLVCQLRHLTQQDMSRLERESLADAADIELRILTLPRSEPVLAQVAFPPGTPLCKAKEFIFRELQVTPLQTTGRNGWLEESESSYFWRLLPDAQHQPETQARGDTDPLRGSARPHSVCLETGLLEWLQREQTVCLEFARSSWTRAQAADWLRRHFRHRDLGRTVFLQVPHRMQGPLAAWVGDVLFPGTFCIQPVANGMAATLQTEAHARVGFVPVSNASEPANHARKPAREAGPLPLEIDLSAGRGLERLPQDLLAGLARHGFANFHEARAVVRTLEQHHISSAPGPFGVIAFHAAQVELIKRLLARSSALSGRTVDVGLPGQFQHGQCQLAVVSLTRSNSQKTGVFAAETTDPILALTRARERLILVGDPDTLLRWSQAADPAESAEARERHWLRRLARYLRSEGSHQKVFAMEPAFAHRE